MERSLGRYLLVGALVGSAVLGAACKRRAEQPAQQAASATPAETPLTAFAALPPVGDLPAAKVTLGRRLFHDPRLSGDGTISCASCHSLDQGGADGRRTSTGIRGQIGPINSPTVLNARHNFVQFWDGRAADLAAQAAGPVANPAEMGNTWVQVVETLRADPSYVEQFRAAYQATGITEANVRDAIATYEMSLVTPSRFDRYLGGDRNALTAAEREGLTEFVNAGCTACHTGINVGGTMYQKMGLVQNYFQRRGTPLTDADNGRFNVTHAESDRHFFKVPTLRNVALTAPYFHDGAAATLDEAVRTMALVQLGRTLEPAQVQRIVTFLNALTGEIPAGARMPPNEGTPAAAPGAPAPAAAAPAAAAPAAAAPAAAAPAAAAAR